jgi:hypothetical protein
VRRCNECGADLARSPHALWCEFYPGSSGVGDDIRGAFSSEHPPAWHRARLDRMVRSEWRFVVVVVVVLLLGAIAGLLT